MVLDGLADRFDRPFLPLLTRTLLTRLLLLTRTLTLWWHAWAALPGSILELPAAHALLWHAGVLSSDIAIRTFFQVVVFNRLFSSTKTIEAHFTDAIAERYFQIHQV